MCIFCQKKNIEGLKRVDCYDCPVLKNVDALRLEKLSFSNCRLLTNVRVLELKNLDFFE